MHEKEKHGKNSGGDRLMDSTIKFRPVQEHRRAMQEALREVYNALVEKGYNPINQIVGYILTRPR